MSIELHLQKGSRCASGALASRIASRTKPYVFGEERESRVRGLLTNLEQANQQRDTETNEANEANGQELQRLERQRRNLVRPSSWPKTSHRN